MDGDGLIDVIDPDSDDDGLFDGTEMGKDCSNVATDATKHRCVADADLGATVTSAVMRDTDRGGASDGSEDANLNGVVDPGETDPTSAADDGQTTDSDGDGLSDALEAHLGSDPHDADSDDDGVIDGKEPNPSADMDGDGLIDVLDADSDGDGLFDGTEMGMLCDNPATDASKHVCVADSDKGATVTSPVSADTDHGSVKDGVEDKNHNGVVDPGETDPTAGHGADDTAKPGCMQDSDCGASTSGKVCDQVTGECAAGCSAKGNGCPAGEVCSTRDGTVGHCTSGGAGGSGGGGGAGGGSPTVSSGCSTGQGGEGGWAWVVVAAAMAAARRRRGAR
jgi:MYXO-CTERM domain-containing protein